MAARNWATALFDRDLTDRLDLPLARETRHIAPAAELEPARDSKQPASNDDDSTQRLAALSCSLDPSLG
jgi:hypothetical protein